MIYYDILKLKGVILMKKKYLITILITFFIIGVFSIYWVSEYNKNGRINIALQSHLNKLSNQYEAIMYNQNITAVSTYQSIIKDTEILDILNKLKSTMPTKEKDKYRNSLYEIIKIRYDIAKLSGVLQMQFVFPDNTVFLRMHKKLKFDDNLKGIRYSYEYVNKTHKRINGFEQGRSAHGFRNIFPILNKDGKYLMAIEISFASEVVQNYLTNIGHMYTHFLVNKDIFKAKSWQRDDLILKYVQSSESDNYMFTIPNTMTKKDYLLNKKFKLKERREEIDQKIKKGDKFAIYTTYDGNNVNVASFYPIKNIKDKKTVAWIVSYNKDDFIKVTLDIVFIIRVILCSILLLLIYFSYRILMQKEILKKEVDKKTKDLKIRDMELENLNRNLEKKIKEELEKNTIANEKLFKSERLASMGEMIGNIAHQWRQPLSVISTGATGIQVKHQYGMLDDKYLIETSDMINKNAQYLSKTIDDFKNFIKGERIKENFHLKNTIDSFHNLIQHSIKNHNINMIIDIDENIKINGYSNELIQCLINIFNNSKDAYEQVNIKDRYFFISAKENKDNVSLKLYDNALGIPNHIIDKVFDPYFTTKHKNQGTGLGLNMTYKLITEGMKGHIEVNNETYLYNNIEYTGAMFTISLPTN